MNPTSARLPLWLKLAFTGFLLVMVPVYWVNYGPTNFLYFCDVALLLCLISVWTECRLPASMAAVGILLPQVLWCADFVGELGGHHLLGLTSYMFDENRSWFLRGLSLFHGWLPFLILLLVKRLGYDQRALTAWTLLAWGLCLVAYCWLPPAGAAVPNPKIPVNINYVFGFDDAHPQTWLAAPLYLLGWMLTLLVVIYLPTHWALGRWLAPKVTVAAAATCSGHLTWKQA